jgi:methyl-accepting chemotaxis protein
LPAETLLIILVAATAFALILQTVVVFKTMRSTSELVRQMSKMSDSLEQDAREVASRLQNVASGVEHLQSVFDNLGTQTRDVARMLEGRSTDLSRLIDSLIEVGNRQAEKVDEVVTDTVTKFEQTTAVIQQDILRPVVEISAILKGLRTGLGFLVNKPASQSRDQSSRDEEMFI